MQVLSLAENLRDVVACSIITYSYRYLEFD